MKLEELVPPLELCKLIPAGEFEDSVFIHEEVLNSETKQLISKHICKRVERPKKITFIYEKEISIIYPAPTAVEIMEKLNCPVLERLCGGIFVIHQRFGKEQYMRCRDKSSEIAAMKLYLKLKGIEYAE